MEKRESSPIANDNIKVLIAASEAAPLAKTGGLADVIGSLPRYLIKHGVEAAVVMPKYRGIDLESVVVGEYPLPVGDKKVWGRIERTWLPDSDVPLYLIGQNQYYDRKQIYGEDGLDYTDNLERFTFFCRAVLALVTRGLVAPHIIHANDWQTGLIPAYLKTLYADHPGANAVKSLFTIHNLAYQGNFPPESLSVTGIGEEHFHMGGLEFYRQLCLMKAGIEYSDFINTVSRQYAAEIQTMEFGCGLEGVLRRRSACLAGILNGVDYSSWSPECDPLIHTPYTIDTAEKGKEENKRVLQKKLGLPETEDRVPLLAVVSRLAQQKGLDLLAEIVPELIKEGAQLAILGEGEPALEEAFRSLQKEYPQSCAVRIAYDNPLAHAIEAGADLFLMPSRFEPCGLNQMYSLRYGTIPIVRNIGGLADTIADVNRNPNGNGFSFDRPDAEELYDACKRAMKYYKNKPAWNHLVRRAMSMDFSWNRAAEDYIALYEHILNDRR